MEHKGWLPLLVLFLGFSFVLSSVAVPTSRSLKSFLDDPLVQDLLAPDGEMDMGMDGELSNVEEFSMQGRMDLENNDYPGTGANNHHDPNAPGRA
ncbi:Protein Rev like [Actinidia chinensis var. chinensis]|uniref:Protein Rev like n=1 Tax=Actinidia chinensis var. chinensis TaxID=1590841 RepID=A0A2R6Q481_ACTCC|nr:Protein Rev like [Actinidia chinensis var. chinensis]